MLVVNCNILLSLKKANTLKRPSPLLTDDWVICTNLTTYNVRRLAKPLAICDWIYIGRTNDVIKFFDIEMYPEKYFEYFVKAPNNYGDFTRQRYSAEQWIILNAYQRELNRRCVKFDYCFDDNERVLNFHSNIIANDIRIFSMSSLGLKSFKYKIYNFSMYRMLSEKEWKKNYFIVNNIYMSKRERVSVFYDPIRICYDLISMKWPRVLRRKFR
ncbi:WavE lipopolysaccharide synthesis family protein, partial [Vibrio sp. D173a]|uniref:WavE lipopolysaccharide synthesis family protein n=1 Tax=Vibrio sp. D173a TaxID=2836349 RepID=UPI0025558537